MNQTRTFLLFALMAVAYLLFMAWEKDYAPPPPPAVASASSAALRADDSLPVASATAMPATTGTAAARVPGPVADSPAQTAQKITIDTDVLHLVMDTRGGSIVHADLLAYPSAPPTHKVPHPPATTLLDEESTHFFTAQSGLVSSSDTAPADQPSHQAVFHSASPFYALAAGQNTLDVPLTWQDAAGLKVTKTYHFQRGSYVIGLSQRVDYTGSQAWTGKYF